MANPLVNIIIANYNYSKWILDAFNSAVNQSYPDISITIVDDCSTDDSWQKIHDNIFKSRSYNKVLPSTYDIKTCVYNSNGRDIPITAIRLDQNYGPSFARNIAIAGTIDATDYYMILDADDFMYKNKVLRCVETAMKIPHLNAIVYADYMTHNTENLLDRIEYKQDFDIEKLYRDCIIHSGALISKQALVDVKDDNGYYDSLLRVCEDYDLWLRITKKYTAVHIPECLTLVRVTPDNSTNTVGQDIRNACLQRIKSKLDGTLNV